MVLINGWSLLGVNYRTLKSTVMTRGMPDCCPSLMSSADGIDVYSFNFAVTSHIFRAYSVESVGLLESYRNWTILKTRKS
jgi:hypothetical protein